MRLDDDEESQQNQQTSQNFLQQQNIKDKTDFEQEDNELEQQLEKTNTTTQVKLKKINTLTNPDIFGDDDQSDVEQLSIKEESVREESVNEDQKCEINQYNNKIKIIEAQNPIEVEHYKCTLCLSTIEGIQYLLEDAKYEKQIEKEIDIGRNQFSILNKRRQKGIKKEKKKKKRKKRKKKKKKKKEYENDPMDEYFDDEAEEGEEEDPDYMNEDDNALNVEDEDKEYLYEGSDGENKNEKQKEKEKEIDLNLISDDQLPSDQFASKFRILFAAATNAAVDRVLQILLKPPKLGNEKISNFRNNTETMKSFFKFPSLSNFPISITSQFNDQNQFVRLGCVQRISSDILPYYASGG
ncbi:MAG: hypothetical protein EZS28_039953, partial [Streblomastix strix]